MRQRPASIGLRRRGSGQALGDASQLLAREYGRNVDETDLCHRAALPGGCTRRCALSTPSAELDGDSGSECVSCIDLPKDPGGWVRAGLLFGYPPASTAAIVGMGLGLDGFAEIDVDPDELPFKLHEPRWMLPVFTGSSAQANTLAR